MQHLQALLDREARHQQNPVDDMAQEEWGKHVEARLHQGKQEEDRYAECVWPKPGRILGQIPPPLLLRNRRRLVGVAGCRKLVSAALPKSLAEYFITQARRTDSFHRRFSG